MLRFIREAMEAGSLHAGTLLPGEDLSDRQRGLEQRKDKEQDRRFIKERRKSLDRVVNRLAQLRKSE